jgi:hypothetical protein
VATHTSLRAAEEEATVAEEAIDDNPPFDDNNPFYLDSTGEVDFASETSDSDEEDYGSAAGQDFSPASRTEFSEEVSREDSLRTQIEEFLASLQSDGKTNDPKGLFLPDDPSRREVNREPPGSDEEKYGSAGEESFVRDSDTVLPKEASRGDFYNSPTDGPPEPPSDNEKSVPTGEDEISRPDGPPDILDLRPFAVTDKPWFKSTLLLLSLLILLLLFLLLRKKRVKVVVASLSPYERAMKEIEAAHAWIGEAQPKRFAVDVSDAVRTYVEHSLRVKAVESTTEELTRILKAVQVLDDRCRDDIQRFLEGCDFIKFTGNTTSMENHEGLYATAKHFVDTVEKLLHPPSPESSAEVKK